MNSFVKSLLISSALVSVMATPSLEAGRETQKRHEDGRFENISGKERVFPKARGKYSGILPFNGNFNEPRRTRSSAGLSKSELSDDAARSSVQAGAGSSITTLESPAPASTSESESTVTVSPVSTVSSPTSTVSGHKRHRLESVNAAALTHSPFRMIAFQRPSAGIPGFSPERVLVSKDAAVPPTQSVTHTLFDDSTVDPAEFTVAYGEKGIAPSGEEDDRDTFPIPGTPHLTEDVTTSHEVTGTNGTPEPIEPVMAPRQIKPLEITILPINWTFGVSVKINPVPTQPTVLNQAQSHKYILKLSAGSQRKNNQLPSGETDKLLP